MRSIKILLLAVICSFGSLEAQPVGWMWANSFGGTAANFGFSKTTDAAGNIYTAGYFRDMVDFDPGSGVFVMTASGTFSDVFITKSDSSGNFIWAKQIGGTGTDGATAIQIDSSTSDLYLTGYFSGTVDFDPGAGSTLLTSAGNQDAFIARLDSSGSLIWAVKTGGAAIDWGLSIVSENDVNGNVYTSGKFSGTVDFDPGPGVFNLTASGATDIFIVKTTGAGNFIWAKSFSGSGTSEGLVLSQTLDQSSQRNLIITGSFIGTVNFNTGSGTFNLIAGSQDIFITKIDSAGDLVWAKQLGGTGIDQGNAVETDVAGNIYTTGFFAQTCDFDPNVGVVNLTSAGGNDIYLCKLDSSGNLIRANKIGGTSSDFGAALAIDPAGNGGLYLTGGFQGTADLDPGSGTFNSTSSGGLDVFVVKLDTAQGFEWMERVGGTGSEYGSSIVKDYSDKIQVTGIYSSNSLTFGSSVVTNQGQGSSDVFIARLDPYVVTGIENMETSEGEIILYPNPATNILNLSSTGWSPFTNICISDLQGRVLFSSGIINTNNFVLDTSNFQTGNYVLTFQTKESSCSRSFQVIK